MKDFCCVCYEERELVDTDQGMMCATCVREEGAESLEEESSSNECPLFDESEEPSEEDFYEDLDS